VEDHLPLIYGSNKQPFQHPFQHKYHHGSKHQENRQLLDVYLIQQLFQSIQWIFYLAFELIQSIYRIPFYQFLRKGDRIFLKRQF